MAQNNSKDDLKTDSFLRAGDSFLKVIEDKWPLILAVAAIVVVAGASYAGYEKWTEYTEEKAQADVFVWMNQIDKKRDEYAQQKQADLTADKKEDSAQNQKSENFETDYASLVTNLESEIKDHKKTVAGQAAAMKLADFLVEQKRVEQAASLMQEVEAGLDKDSWIYGLFKVQFASLLSKTGKSQEAFEKLNKVTESKSSKFLHPEALLKMGVLQEEMGNVDKAREIYNRVGTDYGDTEAGRSAQSLARLLDIQQQLTPNAPKTPQEGASL